MGKPPAHAEDRPERSPRVGEAIGHLYAARDELEAAGYAPDGEALTAIEGIIESLNPCVNR